MNTSINIDRGEILLITREKLIENNNFATQIPKFTREFNFESKEIQGNDPVQYQPAINSVDSISTYVQRAHSLFEKITTESRFTQLINAEVAQDLPVGINKEIAGYDYLIGIDSIYFTPERSYIVAYMSLAIPTTDSRLAFRGVIPFTKAGGIEGVGKLTLLENLPVNLSEKIGLHFLAENGKTFIEFDCNGFVSMSIDAEIEFSRDLIVPESENGQILQDGRVKANFQVTNIASWDNLIASVRIDPFQVTGISGWGFEVRNAVFDFSEVANHGTVNFPPDYQSIDFIEGNRNTWTGIFIENFSVRLPEHFNNHSQRTSISGNNILLDKEGFTGQIQGTNILSLSEGDASGWAFSVDNINLQFYKNSLKAGEFGGDIVLPIDKQGAGIAYEAIITNEDYYSITASYNDNMETNLWAANLNIDQSSSINVTIQDGKFQPSALIHGSMSISTSVGNGSNSKVELPSIEFTDLELSTTGPAVQIGTFELSGTNNFANFPLTVTPVGVANYENGEIGLQIDVVVNFAGDENSGFGAASQIELITEESLSDGLIGYEYKRTEIRYLEVDVDAGAFSLFGRVDFFRQDPIYGNGFQGEMRATFEPGLTIEAMALFGNTGDYRYWFVDGMVNFSEGITIFPGFAIYGFGGGAYHHMQQNGYAQPGDNGIGESLSGIKYSPSRDVFMGLKATVVLGTHPTPDAFIGDATLELEFNNNWGLMNVTFIGNGEFASAPAPLTDAALGGKISSFAEGNEGTETNSSAQIRANIFINYDVLNRTLHGNLSVFVDMAGKVKGVGSGGLAGEAEIYFSPDEWFIHIGHPDRRVGLLFVDLFEADGYLMVGTGIPGFPEPDEELAAFFEGKDLGLQQRNSQAMESGEGFAFGASMRFSTGDLEFLMFYAKFNIGAGFDIMLKKYAEDTRCEGSTGTFGVNNWYASGQAYAYIQGKVGIKVNLKFYQGNFDIFDVGLAALLQAELPNPVYMRGMAAGTYNILGGLVKGNCNFEFEIGKKCDIIGGSGIGGVQVIAELTPANGSDEVSVFNSPQAVFNLPVEEEFEFSDVDGVTFKYKIKLDKLQVKDGANFVSGVQEWSANNETVAFKSHEVLPPEKELEFIVELSYLEYKNGNWVEVKEKGKAVKEYKSVKFITGEAPPYIPEHNIVYRYPVKDQFNYYPQEANTGYVKLSSGQGYLFDHSSDWEQVLIIKDKSGNEYESEVNYVSSQKEVRFNVPTDLRASRIHSIGIFDKPTVANAGVDDNVSEVTASVQNDASATIDITTNDAEGELETLETQEILKYHFRTSQYADFTTKFNAINKGDVWTWPIMVGVHEIGINISNNELFDKAEGQLAENSLLRIEADLQSTPWYRNQVRSLVYTGLSGSGISLSRNEMPLGIPPKYATLILMDSYKQLTSAEVSSNSPGTTSQTGTISYRLPYYMQQDYMDIRLQAANASLQGSSSYIDTILGTPFPSISPGDYPIKIHYVLPGKSTPQKTITYRMDFGNEQ